VGTFRNPVGPLPDAVYWRRRLIVLGVPLLVVFLVVYSCTGASGAPRDTAGAIGVSNSSSPAAGVITPAPGQTQSGPPGDSFPGNGPGGASSGGATGSAGATGTAAAGAVGASSGATATGTGASSAGSGGGCVLALAIALDRTSSYSPVAYPAGTFPTFKITATDSGTANCTVDVSGRTLVVTVAAQGASAPVWSSATCSGTSDLRVLGPSDAQTFPVAWKRWESQGQTCPVSKLPTVSPGGYTVSATLDGVTAATVPFVLN
jgi:hypothetical protein